ncbi:MAG: GAF domain-containing protein, partial [candidate division Zixibacteria bacterium]|nr:GAF domain-containing protein [candidate division Zixibacteria bacterium]
MVLVHQKLIWLTALVAVFLAFYKVKSGYHLYRSRALNLMTVGLSLMIFGAMLGLAGSMGIFGPGYSKSIVLFAIESIIGYVGGWALLIWGMAIWLPYLFSVSSRLRKKSKSVNLYDSISRVSAYGDASPATFGKIGKAVMDNYGFQAASFHVMTRTKQLSLFASIGLNEKSNQLLAVVKNSLYNKVYDAGEVLLADENYRPHNDIIIETDSGPIVEALALPVDFGANRIGVMTVYTDHPRVFGQDELGILDSICGNLGLIFYKDGLQRSIKTQKAFRDFVAVILKTVRSEGDLHTRVIRLAKLLE